jgi:hypothetical protein
MLAARQFTFNEGCRCGALVSGDSQHRAIVMHAAEQYQIPIFFLLYNNKPTELGDYSPVSVDLLHIVDGINNALSS